MDIELRVGETMPKLRETVDDSIITTIGTNRQKVISLFTNDEEIMHIVELTIILLQLWGGYYLPSLRKYQFFEKGDLCCYEKALNRIIPMITNKFITNSSPDLNMIIARRVSAIQSHKNGHFNILYFDDHLLLTNDNWIRGGLRIVRPGIEGGGSFKFFICTTYNAAKRYFQELPPEEAVKHMIKNI